jgi:hypothetical protein
VFHHVHEVNRVLDGSSGKPMWRLALGVAPALARLTSLRQTVLRERGTATADFRFPVPPVFVKATRPLRGLAVDFAFGRNDRVIERLGQVAAVHPEGMLHYLRAILLAQQDRWDQAESAFVAACTTPSIARVRKPALSGAIASQWFQARQATPGRKARLRAKAVENTRKLVALGLSPDQAPNLVVVALGAGEVDLARTIVADWERQAPGDLAVQRMRLGVEYAGGAYARVLEVAAKVLARSPKDTGALRYQSAARARIREQARSLDAAAKKDNPRR